MLPFRVLGEHAKLQLIVVPLLFQLRQPGDFPAAEVHIRAGLIQQVNGLIRQEAVCDVPLRQHHALPGNLRGDGHPVELLVIVGDAPHDLRRLGHGGLRHRHRLEAALQGGVLFNVLPVLREGGGANDLDLPPGQGWLQDVGGIHGALRIPGAHQVVDFVNDQDDVAADLHLGNEALHPALKLAPELGPGHQSREVQKVYLFVPELKRNLPLGNPLGQPFGNGSLAHAGFADETGVILLAAVQDLNDPLRLHVPAHHLVQLPLPGPAGKVQAVGVQKFVFFGFRLGRLFFFLLPIRLFRQIPATVGAAEQLVQEGEGGSLAAHLVILLRLILAEGGGHLVADQIQILFGDPHLLHCIINLRNSQLPGALQAVALIPGNPVFQAGDEHHGYILITFYAKLWLHNPNSNSNGCV